jgi:hypothetical protein
MQFGDSNRPPRDGPTHWKKAIALTIPSLFRVPKLVLTVPGSRKVRAVKRLVEGPISTDFPATILRPHPTATAKIDSPVAALFSCLVESRLEWGLAESSARTREGDFFLLRPSISIAMACVS